MLDTINAEELASLRNEVAGWMPELCDIYTITEEDDAGGGSIQEEALRESAIMCDISSGAAHEQVELIAGKLLNKQIFTVKFPALTDVRLGDHLIISTQGNMHLLVQAVLSPESYELEVSVIGTREGKHLL